MAGSIKEVYPNAPLKVVAAELRYPFLPRVLTPAIMSEFSDRVERHLPVGASAEGLTVQIRPESGPEVSTPSRIRFSSRDSTTVATLSSESLILETSTYERFQSFRDLLSLVGRTLLEVARPIGLLRVGLRYIDEIRVPGIVEPPEWEGYVNPILLGPPTIASQLHGFNAMTWEGTVHYAGPDNTSLRFRFGSRWGRVVTPSGPLRFPPSKVEESEPNAPLFLLDLDSFWTAMSDPEEFDSERLGKLFDGLHAPTRALFESAITDKLRNEVLRKEVRIAHAEL